MPVRRCLVILLFPCLLFAGDPFQSWAQTPTNPTEDACGMPLAGIIVATVTYDLESDCEMTGTLEVTSQSVTLTINGEGHTIGVDSSVAGFTMLRGQTGTTLNLNSLTVDGGGVTRVVMLGSHGSVNMSNVTITGNAGSTAVSVSENGNFSLNKTLLEGNRDSGFGKSGNGSALNVARNGVVTMTDTVIRDNRLNGGAVRVSTDGASLTANGCLSFSANIPYDIVGPWQDNSSGACDGKIGNGDDAVIPAPQNSACGFPPGGVLDSSAVYTLKTNCTMTGELILSEGVDITIDGRGHAIRGDTSGSATTPLRFLSAGNTRLTLYNLILDGYRTALFGSLDMSHVTTRNSPGYVIYLAGNAQVRRSLFENNVHSSSSALSSVLITISNYEDGSVTFTDSVFRRNSGGTAMLYSYLDAPITLAGCISFDSNSPANTFGNVTDESTGPCLSLAAGPNPGLAPLQPLPGLPVAGLPVAAASPTDCFQRLGAIGLLCRAHNHPVPAIEVWGVTPDSSGYFILRVTQPMVDATPGGQLVASSPDGRVGVRVWPNRDISFAMGPNFEGKVHHVTLAGGLNGKVIGTVDSFTGPPGLIPGSASLPATGTDVSAQAPRADGSLVHRVRAGDTVHTIALAYGVDPQDIVARNRLDAGGDLIYVGQELLIRDAPGGG